MKLNKIITSKGFDGFQNQNGSSSSSVAVALAGGGVTGGAWKSETGLDAGEGLPAGAL